MHKEFIEITVTDTPKLWCVYMIQCSDNSLYTGITNDLKRRFEQHCAGAGAKYFRGRQAVAVVYAEYGHSRSTASKREYYIKQLKINKKIKLIASPDNTIDSSRTPVKN
ncbi:MAG: GIY-YIG nuclease family protein [Gammaproteobacteria bacterium]|nr:GIY-YIG nuclease family protein [Gammaproteobacteria bacterium]